MATFGDLERALADLYPYRWAVGAVVLALIAAFLAFAWWRGWHLWVLEIPQADWHSLDAPCCW